MRISRRRRHSRNLALGQIEGRQRIGAQARVLEEPGAGARQQLCRALKLALSALALPQRKTQARRPAGFLVGRRQQDICLLGATGAQQRDAIIRLVFGIVRVMGQRNPIACERALLQICACLLYTSPSPRDRG